MGPKRPARDLEESERMLREANRPSWFSEVWFVCCAVFFVASPLILLWLYGGMLVGIGQAIFGR